MDKLSAGATKLLQLAWIKTGGKNSGVGKTLFSKCCERINHPLFDEIVNGLQYLYIYLYIINLYNK